MRGTTTRPAAFLVGDAQPESACRYLGTDSLAVTEVPTDRAWSNTLPGIFTTKDRP